MNFDDAFKHTDSKELAMNDQPISNMPELPDAERESVGVIPDSIGATIWPMTTSGLLISRWEAAWDAVSAVPRTGAFETMVSRYTDPRRHYHTIQHLAECFDAFDRIAHHCDKPEEVELAIWFHDAFYDPQRHDNEQRSAEHAHSTLTRSGADFLCAQRVANLVLATEHRASPYSIDAGIIQDVDLWILAAPQERFWEYESQVRWEYGHIGNDPYRAGRMKVIERFLARTRGGSHLFRTPEFREEHEDQAVINLTASLHRLQQGILPPRHPLIKSMSQS